MKTNTKRILSILNILSWIAFIGLLIQCGTILTYYFISLLNPEAADNFYLGFNLASIRQLSILDFSIVVSFKFVLAGLESYIAYLIIQILSTINLKNPFQQYVARLMEKVSYLILTAWVITVIDKTYSDVLVQKYLTVALNSDSGEILFIAGIIYVFAQIFKRGVEIQSDNELTV